MKIITLILRILFDIVFVVFVGLPIWILKNSIKPFQRGFFCNDNSIRYPYVEDTITMKVNLAVGYTIVFVTILIAETFRTYYFEPKCLGRKEECKPFGNCQCPAILFRLYYYYGYFLFGSFFSSSLTDIIKVTVGRLRPHFIAVCQPNVLVEGHCGSEYFFDFNCTSTSKDAKKKIGKARLSFPSGHSSFIWFCMIFDILYLETQVVWPMISDLLKRVLQLTCFCVATVVSLSRISDYKHHWQDVLCGSILGTSVAYVDAINFAGMFRFPEQQIVYEGIVVADIQSLKQRLQNRQKLPLPVTQQQTESP